MQDANEGATPESPDDGLIGTLLAGRYRVVRKLGEGGMGTVYLAVHEALRKNVALKVLSGRGSSDKEVVARFEREAVASANLRHPNIAEATDFGTLPDGALYLVMEYVEGKTLREVLHELPAGLPAPRALAILRQIAAALLRAHADDVVHRDLKPENVIVFDRPGERDAVKIIDFGIARIRSAMLGGGGPAITLAGSVFGTPEYMAPEQVMGQPADARADQYAFGVTAFEMLTGRVPYSESDTSRLLMKHVSAPIPSARDTAPHLPRAVNEVLGKLLGKRPDDRYATMAEAIAALEAALTAPPPSAGTVRFEQVVPVVAKAPHAPATRPIEPLRGGMYAPDSLPSGPGISSGPGGLPRAAVQAVTAPATRARTAPAIWRKNPVVAGAAALCGLLLVGVIVAAIVVRASSSLPAEMSDALAEWGDGSYAAAGPKLRAELAKNAALALDAEVVRAVASALHEPDGRPALQRLLADTKLGRSAIMAAALADVAVGEVSAARSAALRSLRGRHDLLAKEPRARVMYRDADDCAALDQALKDLALAATSSAKEDLERHQAGHCAEMLRREELCGCLPAGPAPARMKKPRTGL